MRLLVLSAALIALAVPAAQSSFPGGNGELTFSVALPAHYQAFYGNEKAWMLDVCSVRPDGSARTRITEDTFAFDAAWSADGRRLAFVFNDGYGSSVFVRDREEALAHGASSPAWAPDGRRLALASRGQIEILHLETGSKTPLTVGGDPAWSPNGSQIAFIAGGDVHVIGVDGSSRRPLTSAPAEEASPSWSPDGREIVFASRVAGGTSVTVDIVAVSGGEPRQVRRAHGDEGFLSPGWVDPTWSPDGTRIAFIDWADETGGPDVFTMRRDGGGLLNVTRSAFYEVGVDWRSLNGSGGFLPSSQASCGISGTPRADRLTGRVHDDYFEALAGADRLFGAGGDDFAFAGAGDDLIDGGPGDDLVVGQTGHDVLFGGAGRDILAGGEGRDRMLGGPGDDNVGTEDPDHSPSLGGPGDDILRGDGGNDVLVGGRGRDVIAGGPGIDELSGGRDDDMLWSADGRRDTVSCGDGRDTIHADRTDAIKRDCEIVHLS
jgi:dipeptidyl aminopeptidase/acylaminoacyl peptidase